MGTNKNISETFDELTRAGKDQKEYNTNGYVVGQQIQILSTDTKFLMKKI